MAGDLVAVASPSTLLEAQLFSRPQSPLPKHNIRASKEHGVGGVLVHSPSLSVHTVLHPLPLQEVLGEGADGGPYEHSDSNIGIRIRCHRLVHHLPLDSLPQVVLRFWGAAWRVDACGPTGTGIGDNPVSPASLVSVSRAVGWDGNGQTSISASGRFQTSVLSLHEP